MKKPQQRSQAIDVLRGMTLALMIMVNMPGDASTTYAPFLHAAWHGLTLTDLVFPTFMFVVGTALSFTLEKFEGMADGAVLRKIFKRTALIFLCGYLLYWFPFVGADQSGQLALLPAANTRIFGVLQRIALGYCCASLILHYWGRKGALAFSVGALLAYWALMAGFGDYTLAGNAGIKLDKLLLGESHMYHGEGVAFDPEGVLSTLPSIVNVIAGYFAGRFIQERGQNFETIARMLMLGAAFIVLALIWNSWFPINKKLWTSSYVLVTIGIDLVALSTLVYVIDIAALRGWTYFFEVFGRNTLFIYLLSEVLQITGELVHVGGRTLLAWTYANVFQPLAGNFNGSFLFALCFMLLCWSVGYAMDRQRIYIKL